MKSSQIHTKTKSYLLNHIQGFQKCKNHQNIPTRSWWIDPQKADASIIMNTFVYSLIGAYFWRTIHQLPVVLVYGLVNKISFLEQSEHFNFWRLLLPYYCLLVACYIGKSRSIFEGWFTPFQLESFDNFCTFGILVYGLVNKISFLEQSGLLHFWRLLLPY